MSLPIFSSINKIPILGLERLEMGSEMSEKHIRSVLNQSLMASGEKEKLLDLLKVKLIECGWRNEMKQQ